jgi:hypothetical protein
VPEAEPAAAARWLYGSVAGDEPGPLRRILASIVVSISLVFATLLLLASILGSFALIGVALEQLAPAERGTSGVETSWLLIVVTTCAFVGVATVVTWSARRRQRLRADAGQRRAENGSGRKLPANDAGARSTP